MKHIWLILIFFSLSSHLLNAQNLSQTIRGKIMDVDNELPLVGALIWIQGSDPTIGTTTDELGKFKLPDIPIGRINLGVSYLGYENKTLSNLIVNSGKEVVLNIAMQESTLSLGEIEVTAKREKGKAINDMILLSARSISAEETNRYAGGFNDPSRIMSNFAGITNSQDGGNDIIVRGNSPKYIQWRLEGIQITNPNHFADQSSVGGATSTLNNNLLATSDFYTGAFGAEFGDVLSGVYDVKLRAGNNEKFESVFGFGLLGTDLTLEGPFSKNYGGSYLINYRYSTASIIGDLGLLGEIGGVPKFQDAAFKFLFPTKKAGIFSVFGLAGLSSFLFEDVTPALWETPGDNSLRANVLEDFEKNAHLANIGLNHTITTGKSSFIKSTILFSNEGIADNIYESKFKIGYDNQGQVISDSILSYNLNYQGNIKKASYRFASTYHNKINAQHKIQFGLKVNSIGLKNNQSKLDNEQINRISLVDINENINTINSFFNWRHRPSNRVTIVAGIHNMNVLLNNKSTIEPRLGIKWNATPKSNIHLGYGRHSSMESIHNYFAKVNLADGNTTLPNLDLDLLKADHFVIGYESRLAKNLSFKLEAYYQSLFNIPVENDPNSYYATLNEGLEFRYVDLVNEGKGKNYGLELTLEKYFSNQYYFLINGSLYQSKYTPLDGKERNTLYNGNYLLNVLGGKEFSKLGKRQNQTFSINGKFFLGGGRKVIPLLRDQLGNLSVDAINGQFWDYDKAYENKIEDTYVLILSLSYKWNRRKATHELFLNLDNITNHKGKISEFYDESEPDSIGYVSQFGFFPNLMYRVYF